MSGYITQADQRRAAAWLAAYLDDDHSGRRALEDDGPISPLAVANAVTTTLVGLDGGPAAADQLRSYVRMLSEVEHGVDDLDDDG
ncbi:hypothetical protein [Rhodococcus sp. HS-D2]|uniref:hypothetical protein n=1 Tax=Rhodococcus sp. HS-D2 TaxID=1384636 RepID=UPI0007D8D7B8|nr:hypothetical protein [Rhodococcus sp. HS-D2]